MRHNTYKCNYGWPVEATLEMIGGKWKGAILGIESFNCFASKNVSW